MTSTIDGTTKGVPYNIEELRRIKQAKKEASRKLNAANQQTVPQSHPIPLKRSFVDIPQQRTFSAHADTIRVMSFNILAQCLIKRKLFPDSGDILKWKLRSKMIMDEIKYYSADIITFQEMDNYKQFYEESLHKLGYSVKYDHHPAKLHGCAIAYKSNKFDMVLYETLDYDTDTECPPSLKTGNIAQLMALRYKDSPKGVVVGNTHLYWRPTANYERFRQTLLYSKRLLDLNHKMVASYPHIKWSPMLLGDYNTTPDDSVYGILVEGSLTEAQLKDLDESRLMSTQKQKTEEGDDIQQEMELKEPCSVNELMMKYKGHCKWNSIYSNMAKITSDPAKLGLFGEPKFTNYTKAFKGPLDYMFIGDNTPMTPLRLLMLPDEEDMKPSLPNRHFGSDHQCLVADIEF